MGIVNFNKNSNDSFVKGSKMITKKVPSKTKKAQYLKNLSSLDFFGWGNLAITINANIGVRTPTI